jgi:hypothetical protein
LLNEARKYFAGDILGGIEYSGRHSEFETVNIFEHGAAVPFFQKKIIVGEEKYFANEFFDYNRLNCCKL